jgi:hypothetical protein
LTGVLAKRFRFSSSACAQSGHALVSGGGDINGLRAAGLATFVV